MKKLLRHCHPMYSKRILQKNYVSKSTVSKSKKVLIKS